MPCRFAWPARSATGQPAGSGQSAMVKGWKPDTPFTARPGARAGSARRCQYSSQHRCRPSGWLATSLNNGGNGGSSTPRMTPGSAGSRRHAREASRLARPRRCRMMERSLSLVTCSDGSTHRLVVQHSIAEAFRRSRRQEGSNGRACGFLLRRKRGVWQRQSPPKATGAVSFRKNDCAG